MGHILVKDALRVVRKNERGVVTYRRRYKKGQTVDTSQMEPERVEVLVASGALVSDDGEAHDDAAEQDGPPVATGTDAGSTATQGPGPVSEVDEAGGDVQEDLDADENAGGDLYDGMDYAALKEEAKVRNLNAGGSAEDLRGRLREDDADNE